MQSTRKAPGETPWSMFDVTSMQDGMAYMCAKLRELPSLSQDGLKDKHKRLYVMDGNIKIRGLVLSVDVENQCNLGVPARSNPPPCWTDDPAAMSEFRNTTRWVDVTAQMTARTTGLRSFIDPASFSAGVQVRHFPTQHLFLLQPRSR